MFDNLMRSVYQAVDEEVDGGVDYCQIARCEVSKPLQKWVSIYLINHETII